MKVRRKKDEGGGVPEWVVTYGDLMSLLLTFFVLLAALSELKREEKYLEIVREIQKAFGFEHVQGVMTSETLPKEALLRETPSIVSRKQSAEEGDTTDEGLQGVRQTVTEIREGKVVVGGVISFDRFSAEVGPETVRRLAEFVEQFKGHRTKIEVKGHATAEPLPPDSPYRDAWDLSYARAKAVADELIRLGVDARRIRIIAAGSTEPVVRQAYSELRRAPNRRVEIVVTDSLVSEFGSDTAGP